MKKLPLFIAMAALSTGAFAQNTYTHKAGGLSVTLLSEGQGMGKSSILIGASKAMLAECAPEGIFPNASNAFLVRDGKRIILIDTGYGRKLFENLASQNVDPADVQTVLITHMHGDHIGGLLRDGKAAFANAKLWIARGEYDYWVGEKQNSGAVAAVNAYQGRIELFAPEETDAAQGKSILPHVRALAAYGHTPGHTMFLIGEGANRMLVWGDITHATAVQMPYPQVSVTYDTDPQMAARTRESVLRFAAENKIPVAGMHVPYPGMGMIENAESGYKFVPMTK